MFQRLIIWLKLRQLKRKEYRITTKKPYYNSLEVAYYCPGLKRFRETGCYTSELLEHDGRWYKMSSSGRSADPLDKEVCEAIKVVHEQWLTEVCEASLLT